MMNFPCIVCGQCCRKASLIFPLSKFVNEFGVCCYLDEETNRCKIYAQRPIICNVQAMYETYFKDKVSEKEFIRQNLLVCYALNKETKQATNETILLNLIKKYEE